MRTYERTHPWLKFVLDLSRLKYSSWMMLGEAISKIEHIAGVPLNPKESERLYALYLAKGALATTAIEGNTLTEEEVLEHLKGSLDLPPSRQYLSQEIDNVITACNNIASEVIASGQNPISPDEICGYNKLVLRDLPLQEDVIPGVYRKHNVVVGRYKAVPPEDCEYLLSELCDWLNGLNSDISGEMKKSYSILAAIAAHLFFVWIHPFGDGNGRTARLIEFRYLLEAGFPFPAAHLLSNFYNLTRTEYYRQLDRASRSGGDMQDFFEYAIQGMVDQLREQLRVIRNFQWTATWENLVYKTFRKDTVANNRRRRLVLDLAKITDDDGWLKISDIPSLSVRLAQAYAGKTRKTISRDLNELVQMNLVEKHGRKVRANKALIMAFLPLRIDPKSKARK